MPLSIQTGSDKERIMSTPSNNSMVDTIHRTANRVVDPTRWALPGRLASGAALTFLLLTTAVFGSVSPSAAVSRDSRKAVEVETGEILESERVSGNAGRGTLDRFAGATWTFENDGTFIFAPANARTDLFPVTGTWRRVGTGRYRLEASASVRIGYSGVTTGTASTSLECTLQTGRRTNTVDCLWATSMGNAAVVNDIQFAQAGLSTLHVKAKLD